MSSGTENQQAPGGESRTVAMKVYPHPVRYIPPRPFVYYFTMKANIPQTIGTHPSSAFDCMPKTPPQMDSSVGHWTASNSHSIEEGSTPNPPAAQNDSKSVVTPQTSFPPNRASPVDLERTSFPERLRLMLQACEDRSPRLVAWSSDGSTFTIDTKKRGALTVMLSHYFPRAKFSSVRRTMNLFGFKCVRRQEFEWYHPEFHRDAPLSEIRNISKKTRRRSKRIKDLVQPIKSLDVEKPYSSTKSTLTGSMKPQSGVRSLKVSPIDRSFVEPIKSPDEKEPCSMMSPPATTTKPSSSANILKVSRADCSFAEPIECTDEKEQYSTEFPPAATTKASSSVNGLNISPIDCNFVEPIESPDEKPLSSMNSPPDAPSKLFCGANGLKVSPIDFQPPNSVDTPGSMSFQSPTKAAKSNTVYSDASSILGNISTPVVSNKKGGKFAQNGTGFADKDCLHDVATPVMSNKTSDRAPIDESELHGLETLLNFVDPEGKSPTGADMSTEGSEWDFASLRFSPDSVDGMPALDDSVKKVQNDGGHSGVSLFSPIFEEQENPVPLCSDFSPFELVGDMDATPYGCADEVFPTVMLDDFDCDSFFFTVGTLPVDDDQIELTMDPMSVVGNDNSTSFDSPML